jgi:hypothetical protein
MDIFKKLFQNKKNKSTEESPETLKFIIKGLRRKITKLNRDIAVKDQYIELLECKLKEK